MTTTKTSCKRGDNDQIIANIVTAGYSDIIPGTLERLHIGESTYGHGVMVDSDTTLYGTHTNNWVEMANEELYDGVIYLTAEEIRQKRLGKSTMKLDKARELLVQAIRVLNSSMPSTSSTPSDSSEV